MDYDWEMTTGCIQTWAPVSTIPIGHLFAQQRTPSIINLLTGSSTLRQNVLIMPWSSPSVFFFAMEINNWIE